MRISIHKSAWLFAAAILLWCISSWFIARHYYLSQAGVVIEQERQLARTRSQDLADSIQRSLAFLSGVSDMFPHTMGVKKAVSSFGAGDKASQLPYEVRKQRWTAQPALNDLNRFLAIAQASLSADLIYVLDAAGDCIAASNWDTPGSPIGSNYAERDYFRMNKEGARGVQYAVGKTTHIPGLYIASPIIINGRFMGSVVAKADIPNLAFLIKQTDSYVSDRNGVIILSFDLIKEGFALPGATVGNLSPQARKAIYQQVDFQELQMASWHDKDFPDLLRIQGEAVPHILVSRLLPEYDLTVHVEGELSAVQDLKQARTRFFMSLAIVGSMLLMFAYGGMLHLHSIRRARQRLNESEERSSLMLANLGEGVFETDSKGLCTYVNPTALSILGFSKEELLGQQQHEMFHHHRSDGSVYALDECPLHHTLRDGEPRHLEEWFWRKDGSGFPVMMTMNAILKKGVITGAVVVFQDITVRKRAEQALEYQANYDPLTQLPNRRLFYDRLDQAIDKSKRSGLPLALLLVDLDRFKEINDSLGHNMGDDLLTQVGDRISDCVRESDTVARMGGDEFIVILPDYGKHASIEQIARSILDTLEESFLLGQESVSISASIGIALYPDDTTEIETLIKYADQAMYAAKQAGRNRYGYFMHALEDAAQKRRALMKELHKALPQQELEVYYQPIVNLKAGTIHKAEALIRWSHPERGFISPVEFIPLAEASGLITEIGDWVFRQALQQVERWRRLYYAKFQISVNKSPAQFLNANREVEEPWIVYLQQNGLSGDSICIEITEGLLLNAETSITDKLLALRDAGIQVAIDDFGTGYSSLAYLKQFDIDYLKIDRAFVRNLATDKNDVALCEAIIVMAHKLGLKVIAEGVETEQQREILTSFGCDYAQGYLFSRPVPAAEFERLLAVH